MAEAVGAASKIAAALRAVSQPVAEVRAGEAGVLPSLIEQAVRWDKLAAQAEAEHSARAKTARAQRAERDKMGTLAAEN